MKGYSSQDVARLLGLTVAQVRAFARDGFLTPAPGRGAQRKLQFSFQDLVILRTAKALVAARIPARRIRRAENPTPTAAAWPLARGAAHRRRGRSHRGERWNHGVESRIGANTPRLRSLGPGEPRGADRAAHRPGGARGRR